MQIGTTDKKYFCECGKEFTNSQSFNGHKCHCKEHRLAKGGESSYIAYLTQQSNSSKAAHEARRKQSADFKAINLAAWLRSEPRCERCNKIMLEKFGSGRFCSRACANSKVHSDETKKKISATLESTLQTRYNIIISPKHTCRVCGAAIKSYNKTGFCRKCLDNTPEGFAKRQELGKKGYQTMQENGTHGGWQARNITSYAENFWITVLENNNIDYRRELPIWHGSANYFLDFVLERNGKLVDLEIDGKQHTYQDRIEHDIIRDLYLTKQGYLVYRIPWNEINTEDGKQEMQDKITNFLNFYLAL